MHRSADARNLLSSETRRCLARWIFHAKQQIGQFTYVRSETSKLFRNRLSFSQLWSTFRGNVCPILYDCAEILIIEIKSHKYSRISHFDHCNPFAEGSLSEGFSKCSVRIMRVVYVVRQYPLSPLRLCPLPWEFAERKCNFWPSWPASMAEQRGEKTIFEETMPGATCSLAPSHGKYSRIISTKSWYSWYQFSYSEHSRRKYRLYLKTIRNCTIAFNLWSTKTFLRMALQISEKIRLFYSLSGKTADFSSLFDLHVLRQMLQDAHSWGRCFLA